MKFSFIRLIRFRVDSARVFQRVSMNLNMTVAQAACRLSAGFRGVLVPGSAPKRGPPPFSCVQLYVRHVRVTQ